MLIVHIALFTFVAYKKGENILLNTTFSNCNNVILKIIFFSIILSLFFIFNTIAQESSDRTLIQKKQLDLLKSIKGKRKVKSKILFGDLNGDGIKDAFVDWCVEATDKDRDVGGGNALMNLVCMEEGFTVYLKVNNSYEMAYNTNKDFLYKQYGSEFTVDKIIDNRILCSGLFYADDDPRCCPSLNKTIYFVYRNKKLVIPSQKPLVVIEKY